MRLLVVAPVSELAESVLLNFLAEANSIGLWGSGDEANGVGLDLGLGLLQLCNAQPSLKQLGLNLQRLQLRDAGLGGWLLNWLQGFLCLVSLLLALLACLALVGERPSFALTLLLLIECDVDGVLASASLAGLCLDWLCDSLVRWDNLLKAGGVADVGVGVGGDVSGSGVSGVVSGRSRAGRLLVNSNHSWNCRYCYL